ncbi:MAG: hypothetical protein ACOYM2_12350 [Rectinemataceae bacterium]
MEPAKKAGRKVAGLFDKRQILLKAAKALHRPGIATPKVHSKARACLAFMEALS